MPLVIIELPKNESDIYNIKTCVGLDIRVEPLKKPNQMGQCFNCQNYGHSQRNCHVHLKCVKCAGQHPSQECTQPRAVTAKCANCNGPHPASYRGCTAYPPNQIQKKQTNLWTISEKIAPAPPPHNTANFPPLKTRTNQQQSQNDPQINHSTQQKAEITLALGDLTPV